MKPYIPLNELHSPNFAPSINAWVRLWIYEQYVTLQVLFPGVIATGLNLVFKKPYVNFIRFQGYHYTHYTTHFQQPWTHAQLMRTSQSVTTYCVHPMGVNLLINYVTITLFGILTSAECFRSTSAVSVWPSWEATINGVNPFCMRKSTTTCHNHAITGFTAYMYM